MQTLIPPEAAAWASTQKTGDLLAARQAARGRYYDTPLTVDDLHGATHHLHAAAVIEAELARRGIRPITSEPHFGPDPALDPRPGDVRSDDVDEPGDPR